MASSEKIKPYRLGVDIGGTFTDIVLLSDDGSIVTKKVLSSPPDYSEAIESGVRELLKETGILPSQIYEFLHGTTVVTNTIIERKGSRVALITTEGFRDVLELGRFRTSRLYDPAFRKPEPLVERRLRMEVSERVASDGSILKSLEMSALERCARQIEEADVDAIAICYINSYVNAEHEAITARFMRERFPYVFVSASSELLPQIQEYERTSTVVMNAYVGPVTGGYIKSLLRRIESLDIHAPLMIMQSSGGGVFASIAARSPVCIIESGPAAGVVGAQRLAQMCKLGDFMLLDVGGTTAKGSIVQDGKFAIATETQVGGGAQLGSRIIQGAGYPVQAPTIDLAEVGAGGGSIAAADIGGGFSVGPRSAGAKPGPVCYDRGGIEPTVTDANLYLGYISPDSLVGGNLALNAEKAKSAIGALGEKLGLSTIDTAYGIFQIANSVMLRALNGVSSERGHDPSRYKLFTVGGNGSLHGTKLAEDLHMDTVVVPPSAGVFSALGLLFSDVENQIIHAYYRYAETVKAEEINDCLAPMLEEGKKQLLESGFEETQQALHSVAELRYKGQTATLSMPLDGLPVTQEGLAKVVNEFHARYETEFGYSARKERVQFVALKVLAKGLPRSPRVPERLEQVHHAKASGSRQAYFGPEHGWLETPVISRPSLKSKTDGPAIVQEYDCTTVIRPGWNAQLDQWNNILIRKKQ